MLKITVPHAQFMLEKPVICDVWRIVCQLEPSWLYAHSALLSAVAPDNASEPSKVERGYQP